MILTPSYGGKDCLAYGNRSEGAGDAPLDRKGAANVTLDGGELMGEVVRFTRPTKQATPTDLRGEVLLILDLARQHGFTDEEVAKMIVDAATPMRRTPR